MPKTMRLIDANPIETKYRHLREIAQRKGDTRAVEVLDYVLSDLADAPEIPVIPDVEKAKRKKYGRYKNVLLSDADVRTLEDEMPDKWRSLVEDVSEYVAETGKSYKNFVAVIRNWAKRDAEKADSGEGSGSSFETDEFLTLARQRTYGKDGTKG